ncbi:hypothetical protein IYQ_17859 [Aeromonas salmonicida subsp. salmonicida 01-B526]|uniref:Uncharacterized protein n=1 Tax=Aeromonas salmonicida subsp. salmonicida 01-B526 TaxID=1076135 RepID=A0ABP2MWP3_AERSS|nr:hypothetical protein IYQ_17859 [Aeromonas salmonicida subsp. salmonicida 01-B526]
MHFLFIIMKLALSLQIFLEWIKQMKITLIHLKKFSLKMTSFYLHQQKADL